MADKVLRYDSGDLRELTDGQLAHATYLILKDFASSSTGVGTLNVGADTNLGTSIGTFVDTKRTVPVGTHPVDGTEISSTTYTFRQNASPVDTSSVVRPVSYVIPSDQTISFSISASNWQYVGRLVNGAIDTQTYTGGTGLAFTVNINEQGNFSFSVTAGGTDWTHLDIIRIPGSVLGRTNGTDDIYVSLSVPVNGVADNLLLYSSDSFEDENGNTYVSQDGIRFVANFDIKEMDDDELENTLIGKCLTSLTTQGIGSYVLQPTAPATGTWTAITTITNDTLTGANSTKLWRKTDGSVPTDIKTPLKVDSNVDLKEMTNVEISALSTVLRKKIVETGIGTYQISASSPTSPGTWVKVGQAFKDTRQKVGDISFSLAGGYVGTDYVAGYDKNYVATYDGASYDKFYAGTYYSGSYASLQNVSSYVRNYAGTYTRITRVGYYIKSYLGVVAKNYAGARTYQRTFGSRAGPNYTGIYSFTGYFSRNFASAYVKVFSTDYTGSYTRTYSRTIDVGYTGSYLRSSKTINYVGSYNKDYIRTYDRAYDANFVGTYAGQTILSDTVDVSEISLWLRTA